MQINQSLAIVIGIDEYEHIPKLKNAVADAQELAKVLKERYGYKVLLLCNKEANKKELDELLTNLKQQTIQFDDKLINVEKNDRVLFYFAGHGFAEDAQDNEEGKPSGYFMPQDAVDDNKETWLPMQTLHKAFTDLNCHHLLMILDCCFAGRISWVGSGRNAARSRKLFQQSYDRFIKNRTQQIITSAAHDEEARDVSRFVQRGEKNGHSPFAHFLLKMLRADSDGGKDKLIEAIVDDKVITVQGVFTYLQNQLAKEKEEQTPGLLQSRIKQDDGQLVLLKGEYIFPLGDFKPEALEELKLDKSTNPYKGLASFEKEDKDLFYGRTKLIEGSKEPNDPKEGLFSQVSNHSLTVVLGISGSGKSSIVKAGLIPALKSAEEAGQQKWRILEPIRPGESPFNALNQLLTPSGSASSEFSSKKYQEKCDIISTTIGEKISPDTKLLLVIDQAEELFTLCRIPDEASKFIKLLARLLTAYEPQLRIVLTLRSEFEPQIRDAIKEDHWQNILKKGRFFVTPMDREELQQAIEEPAAQKALFFESPKLVNDLIDEVVQMPGALPLLSFTLSALYLKYLAEENEGRTDRTITEEDYRDIGGVTSALTQAADETFKKLKNEGVDASTIRDVMLRMVAISGGELARRRVPISELEYSEPKNQQAKKVIECFRAARLLVIDKDKEDKEYVEPSHDALILGWQQLKTWEQEQKESLILQRRLTPDANEWKKNQQKKFLWNSNPRLDLLKKESELDDNWLNKVEAEFVRCSVERKTFITRWTWRGAITVMLLLGAGLVFSLIGQRNTLISQIRVSTQSAEANLQTHHDLVALLASVRAAKNLKDWPWYLSLLTPESKIPFLKPDDELRPQVLQTLRRVFYLEKQSNELQQDQNMTQVLSQDGKPLPIDSKLQELINNKDQVLYFIVSPDSKQIATSEKDGVIRVWSLQGQQLQQLKLEQGSSQTDLKFSPVGNKLAMLMTDNKEATTVLLWDWKSNQKKQSKDGVFSFDFKSDGTPLMVTITQAVTPERQDVDVSDFSGKKLSCPLKLPENLNVEVHLSPNGKQALRCSGEESIMPEWWNFQKEYNPKEKENNNFDYGCAVSFSPDGKKLAVGARDGMVRWFQVNEDGVSPDVDDEIQGHEGEVTKVTFSPDGTQLTSIGEDGAIRIWDLEPTKFPINLATIERHQDKITTLDFTPDNKQIITAGDDDTASLRDLSGNPLAKPFPMSQGGVIQILFSPDGKQFATAGKNKTIQLWDLSGKPQLAAPFKLPKGEFINMLFNPKDGKLLVMTITEEDDKTYVWDLSSQRQVNTNTFDDQPGKGLLLSPKGEVLVATEAGESSGEKAQAHRLSFMELSSSNKLATLDYCGSTGMGTFFSPDGSLLAFKNDGKVLICNIQFKKQLIEFKGSIDGYSSMRFSRDGSLLATVGADSTIELWQVGGLDELINRGCQRLHDYLKNPNVTESDKHLCDDIKPKQPKSNDKQAKEKPSDSKPEPEPEQTQVQCSKPKTKHEKRPTPPKPKPSRGSHKNHPKPTPSTPWSIETND